MERIKIFVIFSGLIFSICTMYGGEDTSIDHIILEYDSLMSLFVKSKYDSQMDYYDSLKYENKTLLRTSVYSEQNIYSINKSTTHNTNVRNLILIVEERILSEIYQYVVRYAHDIHNVYGCGIKIFSVSGGNHEDIKNLLITNQAGLSGAVFIGDIPEAFFYQGQITLENGEILDADIWPCDLYYMDLNGTWNYSASRNAFVQHVGDNVAPEIFVGRISAHKYPYNEEDYLINYFNRNHNYWLGYKKLKKKYALTFTEEDWNNSTFWNSVESLYGNDNYDIVKANHFTIPYYISHLDSSRYEFIQLACHSDFYEHTFIIGNNTASLNRDSLRNYCNKRAIGYNLFCCRACRWNSINGCIGDSYILGNKSEGLVVVGSTKTGSMLQFEDFYEPMNTGTPIGLALQSWFRTYVYWRWFYEYPALFFLQQTLRNRLIAWHYGMCILGDPLVSFHYESNCADELTLNNGMETDNASYYAEEKINVRNYSVTDGKNVLMGAPRIEITGPFVCDASSSMVATAKGCVCYQPDTRNNISSRHLSKTQDVRDSDDSKSFSVFPNPTRSIIFIESPKVISNIIIYSLSGQPVLQTVETEIDVSALPQGMYIVRATTAEGEQLQAKFIKQ